MTIIKNPFKAVLSMVIMVPFAAIGFACVVLANVFLICNIGLRHIITWSGDATTWALDIVNGGQPDAEAPKA